MADLVELKIRILKKYDGGKLPVIRGPAKCSFKGKSPKIGTAIPTAVHDLDEPLGKFSSFQAVALCSISLIIGKSSTIEPCDHILHF